MIIANPIYDVVFKRLMEDKRMAKFFMETLMEETIEEVEMQPQEFIYNDEGSKIGFAIFRLDFKAIIKTNDGQFKKVLIEIQKAKYATDIMRFRKYLGEQYKKDDDATGGGKKSIYPIVTIYLLGFTLAELDSAVIKVNRTYTDLQTHEIITQKNDFVEKLTHDSYVVQLPRIKVKLQTKLDQLLSIFEQKYFADEEGIVKEYNFPAENEIVKEMRDILHYAGTDPKERKKIEDEREAWRVWDLNFADKNKKIEDQEIIIAEKDKVIDEKDKEIDEQAKLIKELKRQLGEK